MQEGIQEGTFSDKVESALLENGVRKNWLAKQMKLTTTTISNKFKNDNWSVSEKFFITHLLKMN